MNGVVQKTPQRFALYASKGAELTQYDVDTEQARLTQRSSVRLPGSVQYAWSHASKKYLYVGSSDGGPPASGGVGGNQHHLSAFRIDPDSGALTPHGAAVRLAHRPIHITTDIPSEHALVAYSEPSGLSVHRIEADGTLGGEVPQPGIVDIGVYAHQVRVARDNRLVILVTRGHHGTAGRPDSPGALKVFQYRSGVLSGEMSVAPDGGYAFGPRHIDFHPTQPWIYATLEPQHKLCQFTIDGGRVSAQPLFCKDTLADRLAHLSPQQLTGTVHLHPNGRFVYSAVRGDALIEVDGQRVFAGGENTIVTYAIDELSGEPTLIDRVPTRGLHPRCFALEPGGRLLVAANKSPILAKDGGELRTIPASLDLFRVDADGKLEYVRKYDVDAGRTTPMFWMGIVER